MPRPRTDEEFRAHFDSKLDKESDASGCWLWTGAICSNGYGQVGWKGKTWRAHRLSYILSGGTFPEGKPHLCHSEHCVGKKHCCNPAHLRPDDDKGNQADRIRDRTDSRGEKQWLAKLTAEQVLQIRARATESQTSLAREFGVTHKAIWAIIHHRNWRHL